MVNTVKVAGELIKEGDRYMVGDFVATFKERRTDNKGRSFLIGSTDTGKVSTIELYKGQIKVDKIIGN